LLVVGVKNEEHVEGADDLRVYFELGLGECASIM
jgi:hypothetical protein